VPLMTLAAAVIAYTGASKCTDEWGWHLLGLAIAGGFGGRGRYLRVIDDELPDVGASSPDWVRVEVVASRHVQLLDMERAPSGIRVFHSVRSDLLVTIYLRGRREGWGLLPLPPHTMLAFAEEHQRLLLARARWLDESAAYDEATDADFSSVQSENDDDGDGGGSLSEATELTSATDADDSGSDSSGCSTVRCRSQAGSDNESCD